MVGIDQPCSHPLQALWDNSPALKAYVQTELENWGAWSRAGAQLKLGVVAMPWPRKSASERFDADAAWATEKVLSSWSVCSKAAQIRCFAIKLWHVERLSCDEARTHCRRKFRVALSSDGFYDLLDEAEYGYWVLTK